MKIVYPLIPKSNRSLLAGQFWAIPLQSGKYACGRVLDLPDAEAKSLKMFYAGLMDWVDSELPNYETIAGGRIIEEGQAHLKTITSLGQSILGCRPLELDSIEPALRVDIVHWDQWALVKKGYQVVRKSSRKDHELLKSQSTWGYNVINLSAEYYFGNK